MSEQKTTTQTLDDTIKAVENIIGVLNTAKRELTALENEKRKLETEKKELEIATQKLADAKTQLEDETKQLARDKAERDEKIGAMSEEQMRLLKEYEKVKEELSKFAKLAEEAESQELNFERIQALLSIFRVLVEKIWQGQPHYKILMALHGEKEIMTREELKNTTGIGSFRIKSRARISER